MIALFTFPVNHRKPAADERRLFRRRCRNRFSNPMLAPGEDLDTDYLEALAGLDIDRGRVWIDHVEENTVKSVLDAGYWAGMTRIDRNIVRRLG